jgi:hypothetical protein
MMDTRKASLGLAVVLALLPGCRFEWASDDEAPPNLVVISTYPADRQTNVSAMVQIVIRTSSPLDPQFVSPNPGEPWKNSQVILADQANSVLPVSYSYNGEYLTLVPLSPLSPQATYGVAVRPGARDIYGQNIDTPYAFTFSTGPILTAIPNWPPFPAPPGAGLPPPIPGTFSATGLLNIARDGHCDVRLNDGQVLVMGGVQLPAGAILRSCELYNPASQTWTLSQANQGNGMFFLRTRFSVVKLQNGHVLVIGGYDGTSVWDTVEDYDPHLDSFSLLTARLQRCRYWHTSMLLPNGNPIVFGGVDNVGNLLNTMEIYDLKTGAWVYGQSTMGGLVSGAFTLIGRYAHTTTMLPDFSFMNIGGYINGTTDTADLYWPDLNGDGTKGTAQFTGSYLSCPRDLHTATLMTMGYGQGMVVVIGGERMDYVYQPLVIDTFEVYDHGQTVITAPLNGNRGVFTAGAMPMKMRRCEHTSTLLSSGKILVVGGYRATGGGAGSDSSQTRTAEIFDPFSLGYNVNAPFAGIDQTGRFDYTRDPQGNQTQLGGLLTGIARHSATFLNDGRILIAGGRDWIPPRGPPLSRNTCWLYNP